MKEATGELNMTVITVVAIAAVAAFFYAFVWPAIKTNITQNTHCSQAYNCNCPDDGKSKCSCLYDDGSDLGKEIKCPNTAGKNDTTTTNFINLDSLEF